MVFDTPLFTVAATSDIATIKPGTTRSWIQLGWLRLQKTDLAAHVPGATALLSHRRVLQTAIAAKLVADLNMHPMIACNAAYQFTDLADDTDSPGFTRLPVVPVKLRRAATAER